MVGSMTRAAACGVLVLLSCTLLTAAGQQSVAHTLSGEGLEELRADIAAGIRFNETRLVVGPSGASTLAVCGEDTSAPSSFDNVCKIYCTTAYGYKFEASAWLVAPNKAATAGHVVIGAAGWIKSAIVVCGVISKDAIHASTPPDYYNHVYTQQGGTVHWSDAGIVKLADSFPTTPEFAPYRFRLAQDCSSTKIVTVAGYPNSKAPPCHYDGTQQWQSVGELTCALDSEFGLYPSNFDSCPGGSGSRVTDADNYVIGIYVGERKLGESCTTNLVTRILDGGGTFPGVFMQNLIDDVDRL